MFTPWRLCSLWLALLLRFTAANVEKAVFVASRPNSSTRADLASLEALLVDQPALLPRLVHDTPGNAWRTRFPAAFSWAAAFPSVATTWARLDALQPGQRYELRVCWAATQPTKFSVDVYDAATVASTPALTADLRAFITRQTTEGPIQQEFHIAAQTLAEVASKPTGFAFLSVVATADFVAADPAYMPATGVAPPVLADVILDPYILNVLPRSLVPTVGLAICVAAFSTWLATSVVRPWLRRVVKSEKGRLPGGKKEA